MVKVGQAFGLPSIRLENPVFQPALEEFLNAPGPGLVDVILDRDQMFEPKFSSRRLADGRMSFVQSGRYVAFLETGRN
jgi:acetolactate synthase I/II/III large subunit